MRDRIPSSAMHRTITAFLRTATIQRLALLAVFVLLAATAPAQTQTPAQTPFLFAETPVSFNPDGTVNQEGIVTLLRDPNSGVLNLLPAAAAAFAHPCLPEAMEPQGQFLLGVCGDGLAMYSFDSTSGSVLELANAPWSASSTGYPFLAAPESTGQYVYLLKFTGPVGASVYSYVLDTFLIKRPTSELIPLGSQTLPFTSQDPLAVADPNGHGIAVTAVQVNESTGESTIQVYTITFDPVTGIATVPTTGTTIAGNKYQTFAFSAKGNYLAYSAAQVSGTLTTGSYLTLLTMSPTTFEVVTALTFPDTYNVTNASGFLRFDPLGGLLYVQAPYPTPPITGGDPFVVLQVPSLSYVDTLPWDQGTTALVGLADPDGPYVYNWIQGTPPQGLAVYPIDPVTGFPIQTTSLPNPFYPTMALYPYFANYVSGGSGQNLSGPFLSQSTGTLTFPQTTAGQSSAPQTVTLTNVGHQNVSINLITGSGANFSDFALSGTCFPVSMVLAPQASCQLNVTYSPANAGTSMATITIKGNSPTSPQLISLSGTAVAAPPAAPVAAFNIASPYSFPGTITQGTSSAPQNIVVSNTGNAPLHISGVVLGGSNPGDYSIGASTCSAAVAASANCTIPLTFSPLGSGIRSATLIITDDAANSPQMLTINGTATPVASIAPPAGGTTTASVPAGTTATYNLMATPGPGFTGTIAFTCSGVPSAAACSAPSIAVAGGTASPFKVMISTGGNAAFIPVPPTPPSAPINRIPIILLGRLAALCAILLSFALHKNTLRPLHTLRVTITGLMLMALIASGIGCGSSGGSGGSIQPPPVIKTAVGTYTITVTPTAQATGSSKQLPMDPIQLTLTVN